MPRDVPYFPCYADNILSKREFKLMTLEERGLWITITLECWTNDTVPAEPGELAKYLGFDKKQIESIPKERYMKFFEGEFNEIFCPELREYRKKYDEKREKQSRGGKEGVRRKKMKLSYLEGQPEGQPEAFSSQIKSSQIISNQIQPYRDTSARKIIPEEQYLEWQIESYKKATKG